MQHVGEDLRYAIRALRRSPGFALTAIVTLAIGIGVNAAVFTLSKAVLFSGFPSVEDDDRIVYVASDRSACCLSYPDFLDWRAQATSFEGMAVVHGISVSLSDATGFPESRDATEVSAETFRVVGARPILGRDFVAADEAPGAAPVAILSFGFWERRYGRDPAIIGRIIRIDGTPTTVIGVMPEGFAFPQKQDLWLPLVQAPAVQDRGRRDLWFAFGRLAPGATLESARTEMAAIGQRLAADYPEPGVCRDCAGARGSRHLRHRFIFGEPADARGRDLDGHRRAGETCSRSSCCGGLRQSPAVDHGEIDQVVWLEPDTAGRCCTEMLNHPTILLRSPIEESTLRRIRQKGMALALALEAGRQLKTGGTGPPPKVTLTKRRSQ